MKDLANDLSNISDYKIKQNITENDNNNTTNPQIEDDKSKNSNTPGKCARYKWVVISVIVALAIAIAIVVIIVLVKKKGNNGGSNKPQIINDPSNTEPTSGPIIQETNPTQTEVPKVVPTQSPTESPNIPTNNRQTNTPIETQSIETSKPSTIIPPEIITDARREPSSNSPDIIQDTRRPTSSSPEIIPDTRRPSTIIPDTRRPSSTSPEIIPDTPHTPVPPVTDPIITPIVPSVPEPLSSEFSFNTNEGDLKRISVVQRSVDQSMFNNKMINTDTTRKTFYDIFILSEEDASEEDKLFYSKMYTGAISIAGECFISEDETDCVPKEMVDLSKLREDGSKLRLLEKKINFEEAPLALCLFNITDNDFITTITCHNKYPDMKKNEMLLDLYFFRSPAIERKNKTKDNITITINEDKKKKKRFIREKNQGLCNIYNNWGSNCFTDMNITTDLNGNLLTYDELAITNIYYDKDNSFTKTKISNLVDHSQNITKEAIKNYRSNLENLLSGMKPYMEEDVQFPREKFVELYNLIKNDTKEETKENPEEKSSRRRLSSRDAIQYFKEKELFHIDSLGVQVNLKFKLNPGLNTDGMSSQLIFGFDDKEIITYKKDYLFDIQNVINQLSALSKAGNTLATELYDKIAELLEKLPDEMSFQLTSLFDLLQYYDLYQVFNSTLINISHDKIPYVIIKVSNELVSKIGGIYLNIEKEGKVKNYVEDLSDTVYNFVNKSHDLVDNIYKNFTELDNTLLTKNNPFTQITNYYLNNTSISYVKLLMKALLVFNTYFKREFNKTYPKIEQLIEMFREESSEALESDKEYIIDLITNLVNGTYQIVDVSEEDKQKVISNLNNTYYYSNDIIEKIVKFIIKKLDIKDSGYYLSNSDIAEKNKTYFSILSEAEKVLKELNKDDLIDKTFDQIMISFKEEYIKIIKYMAKRKAELFTLNENTLNESSFTEEEKNKIESKIKEFTDNILSKIKREADYKKLTKEYIEKFTNENLDELNELLTDLDVILSEGVLENIANLFEVSLNESLNKLAADIDNNVYLTNEYFDHFYNTIYDDNYLISILKDYHLEEIPKIKYFSGTGRDFKNFKDEISRKERTTIYITKYNQIISNWNYTEKYLKNQLSSEVLVDYKNIFNNIKEMLQSTIDIESLKNYTDSEDLEFYDTHSQIIENIRNRIDMYFSEETFQKKYTNYVEKIKTKYSGVIINEMNYIKPKHNSILRLSNVKSQVYDFCIMYQRKICYGCTNCVWNTFDYGRFCIVLTPYQDNYLKLIKSKYDVIANNINFNETINEITFNVRIKVNKYNSIMKKLEYELIRIKNETLNKDFDYSTDFLKTYSDWVKSILNLKFDNAIISSSYNYYYKQVNEKITELLKDISDKWENAFKNLYVQLQKKYNKIKYTMYEFGIMGEIYQTILKTDLLVDYFDSIILFQKSEFNYTINYYYDYFYRLVNNSYTYILANLPKGETEYNDILMKRKEETINCFNLIFNNIQYSSENISTNLVNQKMILKVEEFDFFKINATINKRIKELDIKIDDKIDDIVDLELFHNSLEITQYSLTTRFYLENKEFGRLMEEIYESLDQGTFFYLNFDNFKDMMLKNWIFDGNDFSNILNDALYETNKEIQSDLSIKYMEYANMIENEIKKYFNRDLENMIIALYSLNIKSLITFQMTNLKIMIKTGLKLIKEKIGEDIKNMDEKNYYAYSTIKATLESYKEYFVSQVNDSLVFVLTEFYQNINTNVYKNILEKNLDKYLELAQEVTSSKEFGEFEMLNSSYKIGEIIYNITSRVVRKYKALARKKIYQKYLENIKNLKSDLNFIEIERTINNELDDIYDKIILPSLSEHNAKVTNRENIINYEIASTKRIEINNTIRTTVQNATNVIITSKKLEYKISFSYTFDFTIFAPKIIRPICESLKQMLSVENEEQITKINQFIQNAITENLDNYLENIIPTFGNEFFDRIIDYNINFKVIDLYSNLHYALGQLFLYYAALARYRDDVESLPSDLKYRLYRLNDLDYTIKNNTDEIINLLEEKLTELIKNLKGVANETYTSYIRENKIIQSRFSPKVLKAIDNNLIAIIPQIQEDYEEALEKYLKDKFLKSFTEILNNETDNMITLFEYEKKRLITELDSLFSLEIDEDLHEVNMNLHNVWLSIINYYKFMRTFSIPENTENFFSLYANTTIVPLYETFRDDLESMTLLLISEQINNKSLIIERINIMEILFKLRELMNYFQNGYYSPILKALEDYNTPSYEGNLKKKRDEYLGKIGLRRLGEEESEDENIFEIQRKESKDVEETFEQLYQLAENAYKYFYTCPEWFNLTNKEKEYSIQTSIVYKEIKLWIKNNKYTKKIEWLLNVKLESLFSILNGYYVNTKLGLSEKRIHMMHYINLILDEINSTRIITANALNNEYENVLSSVEDFNYTYSNDTGREEFYEYKHETEHMINKASATLQEIKEYTEFQFNKFITEGFFKTPSIKARIVDKTHPKNLTLNVRSEYGFCGRTSYMYYVDFNDANYTMTIDYNTKRNKIDIITYTNFDKYNYTSQMYQIPDEYIMDKITYFNYTVFFEKSCIKAKNRDLSGIIENEVEAKNIKEIMTILG